MLWFQSHQFSCLGSRAGVIFIYIYIYIYIFIFMYIYIYIYIYIFESMFVYYVFKLNIYV